MIKPAAGVGASNIKAPREDLAGTVFPVDEGSGVTLTNLAWALTSLGNGRVSASDDGVTAPPWTTTAEGRAIAFNGTNTRGRWIDNSGGGAAIVMNSMTFVLRIDYDFAGTNLAPLLQSGDDPAAANIFRLLRPASGGNTLDLEFRDSGANLHRLRWTNVTGGSLTIVAVLGRFGANAWLHAPSGSSYTITEATAHSGTPKTTAAAVHVPAGDNAWIGYDPTSGAHAAFTLKGLSMVRLNIANRGASGGSVRNLYTDWLLADPHAYIRARPDSDTQLGTNCCPQIGAVTQDRFSAVLCTAENLSGTVYFRMRYSDSLATLDSSTHVSSTASSNQPLTRLLVEVSGLSAIYPIGTQLCGRGEWSTDGTTFYPLPCALQWLRLSRADGEDFDIVSVADSHKGDGGDGGPPAIDMGQYLRITHDSAGNVLTRGTGLGSRKLLAWHVTMEDIALQTEPDFILDLGDDEMLDTDSTSSTDDKQAVLFLRMFRVQNANYLLHMRAPKTKVVCNHSGRCRINQALDGARQKGATVAYRSCEVDYTHEQSTYGGENGPRSEWLDPSVDSALGVDAAGLNDSPRGTWGSIQWGDLTLTRLDTWTYPSGTDPYIESPQAATLGPSQMAHLRAVGEAHRTRYWLIAFHSWPGGIPFGQVSGTDAYQRINVVGVRNDALWSGYGQPEPPEQLKVFSIAQQSDGKFVHGHDHKGHHARKLGVDSWCCPSAGANSLTNVNNANAGWPFDELAAIYGTAESGGLEDADGADLTPQGALALHNIVGYMLIQVRAAAMTGYIRQTWATSRAASDADNTIDKYTRPRFLERQMSGTYTKDGDNNISLIDSLNPNPVPRCVHAVFDASEISGNWWENDYATFTERYTSSADYRFDEHYANGTVAIAGGAAASVQALYVPRWVYWAEMAPPRARVRQIDRARMAKL